MSRVKRPQPPRLGKRRFFRKKGSLLRLLLALLGVSFFLVGPLWLWHKGILQEAYRSSEIALRRGLCHIGFRVKDLKIEGRRYTPLSQIHHILGDVRGTLIFSFDPLQVRDQLMALPWVRSAMVQRLYPDCLSIRISEHHPIALWQHKKRYSLIHDQGGLISGVNPRLFGHLMVMSGEKAPPQAPQFMAILGRYPPVIQRVTQALYQTNRRWDIILDRRLKVKLPEENLNAALEELMTLAQKGHLSNKDISEIDLRFQDRWLFRLSEAAFDKRGVGIKKR